ncbi:MAG: AbrB/MazE/SpoVT family DNA-binding domain-containing protein [Dehalococcoidia bacterium]|nr:AbrB/MazE/SpoVT family DNA-binding domain-containing protein [Dehalococcoidia bacterium]
MKSRIGKWGNSLAVRIPHSFAKEVGIRHETDVELSLTDGAVVIKPFSVPALDKLLAEITHENLHRETETGGAVGCEAW